jgi:hypothetical protein
LLEAGRKRRQRHGARCGRPREMPLPRQRRQILKVPDDHHAGTTLVDDAPTRVGYNSPRATYQPRANLSPQPVPVQPATRALRLPPVCRPSALPRLPAQALRKGEQPCCIATRWPDRSQRPSGSSDSAPVGQAETQDRHSVQPSATSTAPNGPPAQHRNHFRHRRYRDERTVTRSRSRRQCRPVPEYPWRACRSAHVRNPRTRRAARNGTP